MFIRLGTELFAESRDHYCRIEKRLLVSSVRIISGRAQEVFFEKFPSGRVKSFNHVTEAIIIASPKMLPKKD